MVKIVEAAKSLAYVSARWIASWIARWISAGCIGTLLFTACASVAAAQNAPITPNTVPSSVMTKDASTQKPTFRHATGKHATKKHAMKKKERHAPVIAAIPQPPPAPPPPDWPALSAPTPAEVQWNGKQLSVSAKNSSLKQTIDAVSAATHIPVTGLQSDSRLFGEYGPGTPRQVLSELLEGSGYDLLMVGGSNPGVPKSVELSRRSGGSEPPERAAYIPASNFGAANPALAQQQLSPAPPQPLNRPQGMTPQEFIQQRMQMLQQQRQNAQQQSPQ